MVKQAAGLPSPVTDQLAVARYLAAHDIDQYISCLTAVYKTRRDAVHAELTVILPKRPT